MTDATTLQKAAPKEGQGLVTFLLATAGVAALGMAAFTEQYMGQSPLVTAFSGGILIGFAIAWPRLSRR